MLDEILNNFPLYKISILKKLLIDDDVWFQKSKSQNFLIDKNYIIKIFKVLSEYKSKNYLEIGGGSGNISIILLILAEKFEIIELDRYFYQLLSYIFNGKEIQSVNIIKILSDFSSKIRNYIKTQNKKVSIINDDFLNFEISQNIENDKFEDNKFIVFGNIPYNISTKILIKLSKMKKQIDKIFLTTQKEYFQRLEGKEEKSFLTIFSSYHFETTKLFDIPPSAFYPEPKVKSSFFMLTPKENFFKKDEEEFFKFVSKSFSNKRKKLINNFKEDEDIFIKLKQILLDEKIDLDIRAESLELQNFINIFKKLNHL